MASRSFQVAMEMTDREYVESTVAYLAEHVPWMWDLYRKTFERAQSAPNGVQYVIDDPTERREWLVGEINRGMPDYAAADWWDERGESKLADLLRQQACRFRKSALASTRIECEHGYDVCPICDPCDCGTCITPKPHTRALPKVRSRGKK